MQIAASILDSRVRGNDAWTHAQPIPIPIPIPSPFPFPFPFPIPSPIPFPFPFPFPNPSPPRRLDSLRAPLLRHPF